MVGKSTSSGGSWWTAGPHAAARAAATAAEVGPVTGRVRRRPVTGAPL